MSGLQVVKIDVQTKQPLKDAKFNIYKMNGELLGQYTTNSEGLIIIETLENGWYKVSEYQAPDGYLLDNTPQDVEIKGNQFVKLVFENLPKSSLVIKKFDATTKEPLMGAKFKITKKSGEIIGEYTTNANGIIQLDKLDPGWYSALEITAPDGYKLYDMAQDFEILHTDTITLEFPNHKLTSLIIKKVDDKTGAPLSGAKFYIERQNGTHVGEYTTDSDGLINLPTLTPDWYVVREIKAPDGYMLDETPKTIEIKTETPTVITFTNKKLTTLVIKKISELSGAPLAGAKFTVEKQNGERVGEYTTDSTGIISIPTLLPDWYIVRETKAPTGYLRDETPKTVEVKTSAPTIVTFTNKPLSGLQIKKIDSVTRQPIESVLFSVSKMNGEKIGEYRTGGDGLIYISQLEPGWYSVYEVQAANGYFKDSEPRNVEVVWGKNAVVEVENTPVSSLLIVKTDTQTGKPLQGVVFDVKRSDGQFVQGSIKDRNQPNTYDNSSNKSTSPNGDISGSYTTDANGRILINAVDAGEYSITETKALPGYELDTDVHAVTVQPGKQAVVKLTNKPLAGLRILKVDSVTGAPISNVEFMVFDLSGKVVGVFYSDNNGVVDMSAALVEGRYKIRETRAAEGLSS